MSQLKYGVVLSYVSMGANALAALLVTPMILRVLGQGEWGLYQLVSSVVGYLGLLSFGFGGAYVRFYTRAVASGDDGAADRLNALFLMVFLLMGAVAAVIGTVLLLNTRAVFGDKLTSAEADTARVLMGVMTMTVAVSFPASLFSAFLTANERFVLQRGLELIRVLATPALSLVVVLLGYRSVGMAVVAAAVALLIALVSLAYSVGRLNIRFSIKGLDLPLLREIGVFSSYLFINSIVAQVNWSVDQLILGHVAGTAAVALYALASKLNGLYLSLSSTVSSVFIPRVNRLEVHSGGNTELTELLTRVGRVQFLILALAVSELVVFGAPFIAFWVGAEFAEVYPVALLLIIPVTIPQIQNLGIEILNAKNMHQFRAWAYLGIAILNLLVSIPLAQRFGAIGPALGTAASFVLGNGLLMNWYYHTRVGLDMAYFWRSIGGFIPALTPVVIFGVVITMFIDLGNPWVMIAWGVAFGAVYCCSMWLFGMNTSEKDLIRRPLARLLR